MAGRGAVSAEDARPIARCLKLNRGGNWAEASTPRHFDTPSCKTLGARHYDAWRRAGGQSRHPVNFPGFAGVSRFLND